MKRNIGWNGFTLFVGLSCLLNLVINLINHRFHPGDFTVYYSAAKALTDGDPVYMVSFYTGSGFYKYSPVILLFFLPYLPFGLKIASILHFLVQSLAYWLTYSVLRERMRVWFPGTAIRKERWLLALSFAAILIHLTRELYVGNINILLLLLCTQSIHLVLTGKERAGGIVAGLAILAKPYLVILLLPALIRRRWKMLGWVSTTVAAGLLIPFFYPGPQRAMDLYAGWIRSLGMHSDDFPGMTSIDYLVRLVVPAWPAWGIWIILLVLTGGVTLLILNHLRKERVPGEAGLTERNFAFEWFLLGALIPNLIKTDWVLLQFSAPLIVFIIFTIGTRRNYGWIPLLVVLLFFYGANSDDLLGRELSRNILHLGLMGLANFFLVIVGVVLYGKSQRSAVGSRQPAIGNQNSIHNS
ncbi:MAG TPA: glycosyltransferase family 87 protein [Bacteroidales bacterium]|nr:glycosyltransferase family 87 protein [Bacteroidales bacterium]